MVASFSKETYYLQCDILANLDKDLKKIIDEYGYPTFWSRAPSFTTLVHIILEQQVSLESALAAFKKLQESVGEITPSVILLLSNEEFRSCSITKQKTSYLRSLAQALVSKELILENLFHLSDNEVKSTLKIVKGIGEWTANIFLMMCLHRTNCFPFGDVALITSFKEVKNLPRQTPIEIIEKMVEEYEPYKTTLAYLLWWNYLKKRNRSY